MLSSLYSTATYLTYPFTVTRRLLGRAPDPELLESENDDPLLPSESSDNEPEATTPPELLVVGSPSGNSSRARPAPLVHQSGYLTLIPLSDSRLRPRHTKLIVGSMLVFAISAVSTVFFTVERGVSVGTIKVHSSDISFNTSHHNYQILLKAKIPIYNPNFFKIQVSGTLNVSFYNVKAGYSLVHPQYVPAQTRNFVMQVPMNASSVPIKYIFTIYTQCFTFPEQLIFFLQGELQTKYLWWRTTLFPIDNYFFVNCSSVNDTTRQYGDAPLSLEFALD